MAAPVTTRGTRTIPSIWPERILKRDFHVVLGKMLQPDQAMPNETEESYLRSANIRREGVDISDVKTMWFSPGEKRHLLLKPGDLLVNEGGDVGRCALWKGELAECYFQNAINRVRPRNGESTRFLYYWLLNIKEAGYIDAIVSKTTIAHLTAEKLENLVWTGIPPMEQKRIATFLDASCAVIDAAVATKKRQIEIIDILSKSIIFHAVTRGVEDTSNLQSSRVHWFGKIPCHWRCQHLKRYASRIQTGTTPPTEMPDYYLDGTIPWFSPGSYNGSIELHKPRKFINETAIHDGVLRLFPAWTVFLIGIGATIGRVGIITQPASCNQQIIGIVTNHRMNSRYLAYQLKIYEEVIPHISAATTLPIFDQVKTGYLPILEPPFSEQSEISGFLDEKLTELQRFSEAIEQQISILLAYRKSLIHECVTGQRRVSEEDLARARCISL